MDTMVLLVITNYSDIIPHTPPSVNSFFKIYALFRVFQEPTGFPAVVILHIRIRLQNFQRLLFRRRRYCLRYIKKALISPLRTAPNAQNPLFFTVASRKTTLQLQKYCQGQPRPAGKHQALSVNSVSLPEGLRQVSCPQYSHDCKRKLPTGLPTDGQLLSLFLTTLLSFLPS